MASSRGLSPRVNRLFNLHLGHIFVAEMLYFSPQFHAGFVCPFSRIYAGLQRSFRSFDLASDTSSIVPNVIWVYPPRRPARELSMRV